MKVMVPMILGCYRNSEDIKTSVLPIIKATERFVILSHAHMVSLYSKCNEIVKRLRDEF